MDKRLKLRQKLIDATGITQLYFAPETKNNMSYPCIRYELDDRLNENADDDKYIQHSAYNVTYITRKPTDAIQVCKDLETIRYSQFVRSYVNDGLYHYLYTIII